MKHRSTSAEIVATEKLSLDERVAILDECRQKLGILTTEMSTRQCNLLAKEIEARGYVPMMFQHAWRIVYSRGRSERKERAS